MASLLGYLFRLAARFWGFLSDKPSILQNSHTSSPQSSGTKSKTTQSYSTQRNESAPNQESTESRKIATDGSSSTMVSTHLTATEGDSTVETNQNDTPTCRRNGCDEKIYPDVSREKSPPGNNSIAPPPDHHDPKDGHIWRAKYIILEDGVLYFYRSANVGNSLEAQEERGRTFLFRGDRDSNRTSSGGVIRSSLDDGMKGGESKFEADHLGGSPTPRCRFPTYSATKDKTRDSKSSIWEKRVALDRVGSVLASEMYFGKQSFVLLGIDLDNSPIVAAQNFTRTRPVRKIDPKTYINASSSEDRLILRAASTDDMRNWTFEIHRSLQILVNKMSRNRIGSVGKKSGRFRSKSVGKVKQQVPEQSWNNSEEPMRSRFEAFTTMTTSTTLDGGDVAGPIASRPKVVGTYVPPQRRAGKYVPPHLRRGGEGGRRPIESPSAKYTIVDRSRLRSEDDGTLRTNGGTIGSGSRSSPTHSGAAIIGPGKRLGGCADPTLIEGSICDPIYVPKKASVVGKVNSKPYGSFGGSPSSGGDDQGDSVRWEVGAVSRCGARSSNEDAYLVVNDLLGEPTVRDKSASFFESFQSRGIFAIFDGHCGNHAARFAAEKFPSILLEESTGDRLLTGEGIPMGDDEKARHLLHNAVARLDREFCKLSMADGRNWDSGATALIAVVIGNTLVVAGLGDSSGVLCRATSCDNNNEKDGWTILDKVNDKKAAHTSECGTTSPSSDGRHVPREVNVKLKEVVNPHSPSRRDERKSIEDANGWVVTDSDSIPRVCGDLAVSRALGDREFKAAYNILEMGPISGTVMHDDSIAIIWGSDHLREDYRLFPEPAKDHRFIGDVISSIPEINSFDLGKCSADEFLLLACDGLWDVMNVTDATRLTRNLLFKRGFTAEASAEYLVERAFTLGSRDNVTVIVVRFYGYGTSR